MKYRTQEKSQSQSPQETINPKTLKKQEKKTQDKLSKNKVNGKKKVQNTDPEEEEQIDKQLIKLNNSEKNEKDIVKKRKYKIRRTANSQNNELNTSKISKKADEEISENLGSGTKEEYVVGRILKKRIQDYKCQYYVQWKGYPSSNNTWEPLSNLENVRNMIYQFEYGIPQSNESLKIPRNVLLNVSPIMIERILGHDYIRGQKKYLVMYTYIDQPQWIEESNIPIEYLKQYNQGLENGEINCIIQQTQQKPVQSQNIYSRQLSKYKFNDNNIYEYNEDMQTKQDEEINEQISPKKKKKEKINKADDLVKESDISDKKLNIKRKLSPNKNIKLLKKKISKKVDENIICDKPKIKRKIKQNESKDKEENLLNELPLQKSKKVKKLLKIKRKYTRRKIQEILQPQVENADEIQDMQIIDKKDIDNDENDENIMNQNVFSQQQLSCSVIIKQEFSNQISKSYPKEGSFEMRDRVQRVIIRSSEKDLESMIFEVFWKPRIDNTQPGSKLVRYDELKKYSPESLIYWLEVLVKNSLSELNQADITIKEQKQQLIQKDQLNAKIQTQYQHLSQHPIFNSLNNLQVQQLNTMQPQVIPNSEKSIFQSIQNESNQKEDTQSTTSDIQTLKSSSIPYKQVQNLNFMKNKEMLQSQITPILQSFTNSISSFNHNQQNQNLFSNNVFTQVIPCNQQYDTLACGFPDQKR